MNSSIAATLAAAVGSEHVRTDFGGRVVVSPPTLGALSHTIGLAYDHEWSVAVAGSGTWLSDDTPAQILLVMRALDQRPELQPGDSSILVQAGSTFDQISRDAATRGLWLPLDPPGRSDRTIGSIVATATSGPMRLGFGPVREQLLGISVITGDGRELHSGTTTSVPNGDLDQIKLHVGGFGGFGVIRECRLRLLPIPAGDVSWIAIGDRDRLTRAARELAEAGITAAAVEIISPALAAEPDWVLAVRSIGGVEEVQDVATALSRIVGLEWTELSPERRPILWNGSGRAISGAPVTFRLGVMTPGLDETLDLILGRLGEGMLSASVLCGTLRWGGAADADALRSLRSLLAAREIPLTLERAPWKVRRTVGHFGAYREGVGLPVSRLRESFDPLGILATAVQPTDRAG